MPPTWSFGQNTHSSWKNRAFSWGKANKLTTDLAPWRPGFFHLLNIFKKWLLNSSNFAVSEFYQVYVPTPPIGFLMSSPGILKRVLFWLMLIAGAGAYGAGFYTFLVALGHEPWFLALALASFTAAFGGVAMFIYVVVRLLSNDTR